MTMNHDRTIRHSFRFTLSVFIMLSAAAAAFAAPPHCANTPSIGLGETLRGESLSIGDPDCFRLEIPAAGLLMLDLAVPGTAAAEPRLGILGPGCTRDATSDLEVIEQSASHLLVVSDASRELTVCVGAQDPRQELGEYKLQTTFLLQTAFLDIDLPGSRKAEQIEVDPDPFAGCTQKAEQIEVDPDPFAGCTQKAEQIEVDPDPFAGCTQKAEQIEVDPDPFAGSHPMDALCRDHDFDDHSDNLLCATPVELGGSIPGEIDNGWGDDHDVFVFELSAVRSVQIETSGEVDTFGGLYDRRGQRLAATHGGGDNANFRLAKTLQPGLYFVRVEGAAWSRGAYALTIDTVERSW